MKLYVFIVLLLLIVVNDGQISNSENIVLEEEPNGVPINIQVMLIGFDTNGAYEYSLPADSLNKLLVETYPIHYVHSAFNSNYLKSEEEQEEQKEQKEEEEEPIDKRLLSHYDLKYNVISTTRQSLDRYEQILQTNMIKSNDESKIIENETHTIGIEILESYFESEILKWSGSNANSKSSDYTIIFLNPSKERILASRKLNDNDNTPFDKFKYQYSKNGEVISPIWIGSSRFVVVDLSAGPLKYGTTLHKSSDEYYSEGSIDHDSVPRLVEYFLKNGYSGTSFQGASPIEIAAHISTLVISSIKNVFLFDTKYNYIPLFQKILVPVLIFKDIDQSKNSSNGNDYSDYRVQDELLDIELIKRQTKRLFPFSEVEFVIGEHSIHEHKHISMAFSKSIKSHSSFEMDPLNGKFKPIVKNYLDSKELLLSLKSEDDILAAGLIGSDVTQLPISLTGNGRQNQQQQQRKRNTKILPVYVFTLLNSKSTLSSSNLLLDKYHSYASNQDAIVVLQTNHTYNSTFYKGNYGSVSVNSLYSGTRNIIAGIASSQGLMGPTLHFSESHNRLINNFLWSFGSNPFNLFNSKETGEISQIFIDGIIRNTIITSIQSTDNNLKSALNEITSFSSKYLVDSLGFEIQDISMNKGNFIIDRLYHTPPSKLPILKSIIQRLHDDFDSITNEITTQIKSIPKYLNDKELNRQQKDKISQDLVLVATQVSGFLDYVHKEISSVETQLLCCAITQGKPTSIGFFNDNLNLIIITVALIFSIIIIKIVNDQTNSSSSSSKLKRPLINRNRPRSTINTN